MSARAAAAKAKRAPEDDGQPAAKRRKVLREKSFAGRNIVHVIFAIDQSGSMRTEDVKMRSPSPSSKEEEKKSSELMKSTKATRWSAVFDCAEEFVRLQATSGPPSTLPDVLFSLVLWDDDARTVFEREPLLVRGDSTKNAGVSVRAKLAEARRQNQPRGGTVFASAFREIRRLVKADREEEMKNVVHPETKKYMVLFLTDGRPADLHDVKGADGKLTLNETFRFHQKQYPSAAAEIRNLYAVTK